MSGLRKGGARNMVDQAGGEKGRVLKDTTGKWGTHFAFQGQVKT